MATDARLRIYFTGVGGQGTLTATNLLAKTALMTGLDVVAGEVHGMAQRGGVVESVLLLGGLRSPKLDLNEADLLLGFEPLETLRGLPYLAPNGVVISSSNQLPPLSVSLGAANYPDLETIKANVNKVARKAFFLPARELGVQAGSIQSGNTVLIACACACGILPFDIETLKKGINTFLAPKLQPANLKALDLAKEYLQKEYSK
ncbi:MAG: indolepyruvate oxidoreductase subunit beta [Desulfovibrionaceae bacterium]|nr:indolepyruvate oxidoreductase subunit beta [Desulfovibrionaceae bacterium]